MREYNSSRDTMKGVIFMKRIVNEKRYVEDMIKNKVMSSKRPNKDIYSLIKYLYEQDNNITNEELQTKVSEFLLAITNNEHSVQVWQVQIKDSIESFKTNYVKYFKGLSHVESVTITKNELKQIESLKDKKLQCVAFALLAYLKVQNAIRGKQSEYVPTGKEDVNYSRKITGLRLTTKEIALKIYELKELGFTVNGLGDTVCAKLNYVDYDSEDVITITDFDATHMSLYFKYYKDKVRYIHCQECGDIVKLESKRDYSTKYCSDCRKKKNVEKTLKSRAKK